MHVLHFYVFLKTNVHVSLILFLFIWKSVAIMYLVVMIYSNKNHVCRSFLNQVFRSRVLGVEFLRMSFLVFCFLMSAVVCYFLSAMYQLYHVLYNCHTNSAVSCWFPIFPVVPFGPCFLVHCDLCVLYSSLIVLSDQQISYLYYD